MNKLLTRVFPLLLAGMLFGCSDNGITVIQHEMVITPHSITFASGETTKNVSITHTCTCPFNWVCTVTPPNGVLKDTTGTGDNPSVPLHVIDRSKMTSDTMYSKFVVTSNGYGTDTINVTVIK